MKMSNRDALKVRVAKTKPQLPNDYRKRIIQKRPNLDNLKGANKIHNVINLISADEELTLLLEEIAAEHKAEQQGESDAVLAS